MEGDKFTTGPDPESDSQETGIDERAPLHLKKNAEQGLLREEVRLELLQDMRDSGEIEADTDEMKIIVDAPDSPEEIEANAPHLTESQKEVARQLAERQKRAQGSTKERPKTGDDLRRSARTARKVNKQRPPHRLPSDK